MKEHTAEKDAVLKSAEKDAPRVFDAAIFRHTFNPWTGMCGCGAGPFSVAWHREHVENAMSVTPPGKTQGMIE